MDSRIFDNPRKLENPVRLKSLSSSCLTLLKKKIYCTTAVVVSTILPCRLDNTRETCPKRRSYSAGFCQLSNITVCSVHDPDTVASLSPSSSQTLCLPVVGHVEVALNGNNEHRASGHENIMILKHGLGSSEFLVIQTVLYSTPCELFASGRHTR